VIVAAGANADAGGEGCIASRGARFGGSFVSDNWTWISDWTATRIYADLNHDTDYAAPFFVNLTTTLEHIFVCSVVLLTAGEVPSQV
jgi:hypothetical protein